MYDSGTIRRDTSNARTVPTRYSTTRDINQDTPKAGDQTNTPRPRRFCGPPALRFEAKVDRSELGPAGCWNWTAKLDRDGYAVMWLDKTHTNYRAARLAYELAVGPLPEGSVIRHRCDNPRCVNWAHLLPGTQLDNMLDAVERGHLPANHNLVRGYQRAVSR